MYLNFPDINMYIINLANHNFETNPVFIGKSNLEEFSEEMFKNNYDIVIVDPSGTVNLASKITKSGMNQVIHLLIFDI